jgi:hypothetical protein
MTLAQELFRRFSNRLEIGERWFLKAKGYRESGNYVDADNALHRANKSLEIAERAAADLQALYEAALP